MKSLEDLTVVYRMLQNLFNSIILADLKLYTNVFDECLMNVWWIVHGRSIHKDSATVIILYTYLVIVFEIYIYPLSQLLDLKGKK